MSGPYYQDDAVTLYHGDALDLLPAMVERSVDCVITDPPYDDRTHSMARTNKGRGHGNRAIDFRCFDQPAQVALFADLGRVTRRWVISTLPTSAADEKPRWNGGGKAGNYRLSSVSGTGHPTSKPLSMVADWVRLFTDPGDTVLDPFVGSGTTLRAAKDEGRKAIGIELDERYCELAARRLTQDVLDFGEVTA